MMQGLRKFAIASGLMVALLVAHTALAQKSGGVLRMYHFDSPASLSLHEEVTFAALGPVMGLFNNLVMFDQHVAQASFASIVPDLASEWSWDSSKTELRFRLHDGVRWHDGKPFTANESGAPGILCSAKRTRNFASIRARPGTRTSKR